MTEAKVHHTKYGWVAADDAGWIAQIYDTEEEARAAVDLPPRSTVKRSHTFRNATVEEVGIWCIEQQLDPKEVTLAGAVGVRWESPETQAEEERRQTWEKRQAETMEKWERDTLARLKEKYGA